MTLPLIDNWHRLARSLLLTAVATSSLVGCHRFYRHQLVSVPQPVTTSYVEPLNLIADALKDDKHKYLAFAKTDSRDPSIMQFFAGDLFLSAVAGHGVGVLFVEQSSSSQAAVDAVLSKNISKDVFVKQMSEEGLFGLFPATPASQMRYGTLYDLIKNADKHGMKVRFADSDFGDLEHFFAPLLSGADGHALAKDLRVAIQKKAKQDQSFSAFLNSNPDACVYVVGQMLRAAIERDLRPFGVLNSADDKAYSDRMLSYKRSVALGHIHSILRQRIQLTPVIMAMHLAYDKHTAVDIVSGCGNLRCGLIFSGGHYNAQGAIISGPMKGNISRYAIFGNKGSLSFLEKYPVSDGWARFSVNDAGYLIRLPDEPRAAPAKPAVSGPVIK